MAMDDNTNVVRLEEISLEMSNRIEGWLGQSSKAALRDLYEALYGDDELVTEFNKIME